MSVKPDKIEILVTIKKGRQRITLNEEIPRPLRTWLRSQGYNVTVSTFEHYKGNDDSDDSDEVS